MELGSEVDSWLSIAQRGEGLGAALAGSRAAPEEGQGVPSSRAPEGLGGTQTECPRCTQHLQREKSKGEKTNFSRPTLS